MSTDQDTVIAETELRYLPSRHVAEEFKLFIARPALPLPPGHRAPVIVVLDANVNFGLVTVTARNMVLEGLLPPAWVVGVGYRAGWLLPEVYVKRTRDLSPTACTTFGRLAHKLLPGLPQEPFETGGGPAFLRFLSEELSPFLAAEFGADVDDSLLTGISLGGLFATWVLLQQPTAFKRYLICSPALWWQKEALVRREFAEPGLRQDLPARVFMAAGALEDDAHFQAMKRRSPEAYAEVFDAIANDAGQVRIAEYVSELGDLLAERAYPGLHIDRHLFADESHQSVYGAAVARGLRALYRPL